MSYKCKEDVKPQEGKQTLVMKMIANQEVDFMLTGGARAGGKSELLSMMPLLFAGDPQYRGIFFRRSYDEIMGANGLWQKGQNMYPNFGAKPNKSDKTWTFPSGGIQEYRHMYNSGDEESHRGKGYSLVGFDEIDQFDPQMIQMLMTCLRSEAQMNSFLVGTLNPNPDSWCLPLVEYYLNKDGSPNEEKCGEIRWYIVKDGDFIFGPDEEWFKENHPESVYVSIPGQGEKIYVRPKRFTYVFFNVFDNPAFCALNPSYLSELYNLPDHERATQLFGRWYDREKGENLFQREWLNIYHEVPHGSVCVRAWDKAYSDDVKKKPDFSASIRMWRTPVGEYIITGDFDETIHDDFKKGEDVIYGRFRKLAGDRNLWMLQQAQYDGPECIVVHPEESGPGKGEMQELTKLFVSNGFRTKTVKTGNAKGSKKLKFVNFTSAAQNGLIGIVPDSFSNDATYQAYLKELETFNGQRSSALIKDDWVDATSDCFLALLQHKVIKPFRPPAINAPTKMKQFKS